MAAGLQVCSHSLFPQRPQPCIASHNEGNLGGDPIRLGPRLPMLRARAKRVEPPEAVKIKTAQMFTYRVALSEPDPVTGYFSDGRNAALQQKKKGAAMAVLDVNNSKLLVHSPSAKRLKPMIDAELAYIAALWPNV